MASPHDTILAAMIADARECNRRAGFTGKWTSVDHPGKGNTRMRPKTCKRCGASFRGHSTARYCSEKCRLKEKNSRDAAKQRAARKARSNKRCRVCGDTFAGRNVNQHYCGRTCREIAKKENNREYARRKSGYYKKGIKKPDSGYQKK